MGGVAAKAAPWFCDESARHNKWQLPRRCHLPQQSQTLSTSIETPTDKTCFVSSFAVHRLIYLARLRNQATSRAPQPAVNRRATAQLI